MAKLRQVAKGDRESDASPSIGADRGPSIDELFGAFPYGLFTVDRSGTVMAMNDACRALLLGGDGTPTAEALTCCDLVCDLVGHENGVGPRRCLAEETQSSRATLTEIRLDLSPRGRANTAWVTISTLGDTDESLFHLRPGSTSDQRRGTGIQLLEKPRLRIFALGQTRIESAVAGPIGGSWVDQRPGELLKYLVCAGGRAVDVDEIGQALWPERDGPASGSVRYVVHVLRARLDPRGESSVASSFIESSRGGYGVDLKRVWIDAIEFEQLVSGGLAALAGHDQSMALPKLERAMALYRGDLVADQPYAEWALAERDRLRELAGRALRALVELRLAGDDGLDLVARHARRLADLEPFDSSAQRLHIELCIRQGRRSEAVRRYNLHRRKMISSFGSEPDFRLSELGG